MTRTDPLLLARTVRHLRPVQILGRAKRALVPSRVDESPAPEGRQIRALEAPAERDPVLAGPTTFEMLGETGEVATARDWADPDRTALWRYHTNYFDDLRSGGAVDRADWNRALMTRWTEEVPPGSAPGWDAYPTSLRIVNWVRWGLGHGLSRELHQSLAVQARCLRSNLEWHILGNHLFANAKALVFAGTYFMGAEADEWRAKGLALVRRELQEQVLDDGGHFERSPMYHALILEDVLDLLALMSAAPGIIRDSGATHDWLVGIAQRMRAWLKTMCHPDGEIALFNDSAIGQAPSPGALEDYADRLGLGAVDGPAGHVTHLEDSGYLRLESGPAVVLLDVGEIGPTYLPGHAHADTLSFEVSLHGERWIVDSGVSHYEPGPERLFQRSTAAHNTVEIDGQSSSEVWSSFRVARRAVPRHLTIDERGDRVTVTCSHDGYRRLPGSVMHERSLSLGPEGLRVEDRVAGRFDTAAARVHLHPDVEADVDADRADARLVRGVHTARVRVDDADLTGRSANWHPRFGESIPSRCLHLEIHPAAPRAALKLSW